MRKRDVAPNARLICAPQSPPRRSTGTGCFFFLKNVLPAAHAGCHFCHSFYRYGAAACHVCCKVKKALQIHNTLLRLYEENLYTDIRSQTPQSRPHPAA